MVVLTLTHSGEAIFENYKNNPNSPKIRAIMKTMVPSERSARDLSNEYQCCRVPCCLKMLTCINVPIYVDEMWLWEPSTRAGDI